MAFDTKLCLHICDSFGVGQIRKTKEKLTLERNSWSSFPVYATHSDLYVTAKFKNGTAGGDLYRLMIISSSDDD